MGDRQTAEAEGKAAALTPRQRAFVTEYLLDRNGTQAVIRAGYSKNGADVTACRLLADPRIKALVTMHSEARLARVQEETGITLARTLKEISRIAYFDPRKLFDENGEPKRITDLDDDTAAAIAGLKSATERSRRKSEDGEDDETHIREYKIADKKGGLDMLMKHLGGYKADHEDAAEAVAAVAMTDNELARRIAFALHKGLQAKESPNG